MIKNKKIIYKNVIQNEFFNFKKIKKIDKKFFDIVNNIAFNLNSTKSLFNSLSDKLKLNFKMDIFSCLLNLKIGLKTLF